MQDVHHDFFPLQAQLALDSPATPTHWGCRCCRARTTCTAGFIGLNNIDHGGRQVWADTRYGVADAEHERVHAETFALAPQPHQQHRPADHAARFDNSDPFLGTPHGHRPASKAWGSWSTRSSIGGSRTVQVQQQQQPASNFQDNILLLSGDLIANAGREETIVYEADPDALAVDLVDDRSVGG
ncbi:Os01g0573700 [Oryza sativa Japonica Group]|uniref:Os01g0573700 protein n=1 Tax=Oryza sativa subsp. japonica TaxID=39947 RepID=A0A0N7KD72_ORYSJ|nr:Os01g0573700 [Oryza sativa Japonica Group]